MYFPDVPTSRLRGSALVRRIGGVGYYPRSGKTGFVHIDSGNVRHWPRMSKARMAKILRKYKKTVGARRYNKQPSILLASTSTGRTSSGPTSITPAKLSKQILANAPVPKPRSRPIEVPRSRCRRSSGDTSLGTCPAQQFRCNRDQNSRYQ